MQRGSPRDQRKLTLISSISLKNCSLPSWSGCGVGRCIHVFSSFSHHTFHTALVWVSCCVCETDQNAATQVPWEHSHHSLARCVLKRTSETAEWTCGKKFFKLASLVQKCAVLPAVGADRGQTPAFVWKSMFGADQRTTAAFTTAQRGNRLWCDSAELKGRWEMSLSRDSWELLSNHLLRKGYICLKVRRLSFTVS